MDAIENSKTVAGGHKGIGSITNIHGRVPENSNIFKGVKYLDLFKNKVIQDLSGIKWNNLAMTWGDTEQQNRSNEIEMNKKFMNADDVRKIQDDK
jgi:hypothetical protein